MTIDWGTAPYIPIIGSVACTLGQVAESALVADAAAQAAALQQVAAALGADAITIGWRSDPEIGFDVARRLPGRELVALLSCVDAGMAREYCEAGVAAIFLFEPGEAREMKFKQLARAAGHYDVPVILAQPERADAAAFAASVGLAGAVVREISGDEPGVVGGGLPGRAGEPPRAERFFWTFPGEVPQGMSPEQLATLGRRLG